MVDSCHSTVYALESDLRMKAPFPGVTLKVCSEVSQIITESLKWYSACDISTIKQKTVWQYIPISMFESYTYILLYNDKDKYREPGTFPLEETWVTNSETVVYPMQTQQTEENIW